MFPFGYISVEARSLGLWQIKVGGQEHKRNPAIATTHFHGDLVSIHAWHGIVENYKIGLAAIEERKPGWPVLCHGDLVPLRFQHERPDFQYDRVVIHAKNIAGDFFSRRQIKSPVLAQKWG